MHTCIFERIHIYTYTYICVWNRQLYCFVTQRREERERASENERERKREREREVDRDLANIKPLFPNTRAYECIYTPRPKFLQHSALKSSKHVRRNRIYTSPKTKSTQHERQNQLKTTKQNQQITKDRINTTLKMKSTQNQKQNQRNAKNRINATRKTESTQHEKQHQHHTKNRIKLTCALGYSKYVKKKIFDVGGQRKCHMLCIVCHILILLFSQCDPLRSRVLHVYQKEKCRRVRMDDMAISEWMICISSI